MKNLKQIQTSAEETIGQENRIYYNKQTNKIKLEQKIVTTTLTISENAKWTTFCCPFDIEIPNGVTMYKVDGFRVTEEGETVLKLIMIGSKTLPAYTAVVANSNTSISVSFTGRDKKDLTFVQTNRLYGTFEDFIYVPKDCYVLQLHEGDDKANFYRVGQDNLVRVTKNHCYMTKDE